MEVAFVGYLKSVYVTRGCGLAVTVRNAHGKGPEQVVDFAIRQCGPVAYDRVVVLMDRDLPWDRARKMARRKKIELIGSAPCIEGLLLSILEQPVPTDSKVCKRKLQAIIGNKGTDKSHYSQRFSKERLEAHRHRSADLHALLTCLQWR